MLVLARKIGQQIVLPDYGVVIDVVSATKSQVRLGIEAPADITIYRREILDRMRGQGTGRPGKNAAAAEGANEFANAADVRDRASVSQSDLDGCLARWVAHRTSGRIRQLSVKTVGGQTVIRGLATSCYARRLAQIAVSEVLEHWSFRPLPAVAYEIEIVDRGLRARTRADLSFSNPVKPATKR